jgi:uncharacterized protein YhjY with autotransporter beta-barrel domain
VTNAGSLTNNTGGTIAGSVTNTAGTLTNNGVIAGDVQINGGQVIYNAAFDNATTINSGSLVNNTTLLGSSLAVNGGILNNNATINGGFTNGGEVNNNLAAIINGDIANNNTLNNLGTITGNLTNAAGSVANNSGSLGNAPTDTVTNAGVLNNNSGATIAGSVNNTTGFLTNSGTIAGNAANTGSLTNNTGGTIAGSVNNTAGTLTNNGTVAGDAQIAGGTLVNSGSINGNLTNAAAGTVTNSGSLGNVSTDTVANSGSFTNNAGGTITGNVANTAGTLTNDGTIAGAVANSGIFENLGGGLVAGAVINNSGFSVLNQGTIAGPFTNSGTLVTTGTLSGGLDNAATVNAQGTINGVLDNSGTVFLTGTLGGIAQFVNTGVLDLEGTNRILNAAEFENRSGGLISMGDGIVGDRLNLNGNLISNAGSIISMDVTLNAIDTSLNNDRIIVDGTVLSVGGGVLFLNDVSTTGEPINFDDLVLISTTGGVSGSFTVDGLDNSGLFTYVAETRGNDIVLVTDVNAEAAGGIVANFITAQNTISSAFFKPTSSFVSTPINPEKNQIGFAPWFRVNGGAARDTSAGSAILSSDKTMAVGSTVDVDYAGYQFGLDGGLFDIAGEGGALHVGLTAGQIFGTANQVGYANKTGMTDTFIGAYGIYSKGPLFIDAQVRQEFIDYTVNVNEKNFSVTNAKVGAERFSAGISGGYTFAIDSWSFVPAAGYTYAVSRTDDLKIPGTVVTSGINSSVEFSDSESHLVFGGVSVAKSFLAMEDQVRVSPFVSLTVYHDFAQEKNATLKTDISNPLQVTSQSNPTYGEISAGINFLALTPEIGGKERLFSGNIRGDVQFNEERLSGALNVQMRLQF